MTHNKRIRLDPEVLTFLDSVEEPEGSVLISSGPVISEKSLVAARRQLGGLPPTPRSEERILKLAAQYERLQATSRTAKPRSRSSTHG